MMKGITPIISIIVLLLITVSLAGAAYVFLGGYMTAYTGRAVQASGICVGGTQAFITVTNMGTLMVDLTGCDLPANPQAGQSTDCGDITIVRTDGGSMLNAGFLNGQTTIGAAGPDRLYKATFVDDCTTPGNPYICKYAFTRAGEIRPVEITVSCSGG